MFKKEFICIALCIFSIVFGSFTLLTMLFYPNKWYLPIFLFVPLAIVTGIIFKNFVDWGFEPFKDKKWKRTIIICFFIIFILVIYHWNFMFNDISKKYYNFCKSKGLNKDCKSYEVCQKDCENLNQKYFKYESSQLFVSESCWCIKINNDVQQIY